MTVGATRTIPDERESSISMATVLLRDVLNVDSVRLSDMISELRLRVEQDERNEFEVVQRKNGLKSSTDRVSNDDEVSSMPSSLRSMVSQSQQLGENVTPVLNDVTRRFADLMGSAKGFLVDKADDSRPSPAASAGGAKGVSSDNFDTENGDLGVLLCVLPPKGTKKKEAADFSDATGLENTEDLGVLVCALPPKGSKKAGEKDP